ncbi:MAG: YfcE family phosphodiesterase [Gammaproteobacteria bacterium]|nr:YfcE family phosphodiesterase [Gammaproteobacteria bacterium]MDE0365820.1 YfcE family phosphodiesterase [Gammaproteobacteria bacterium]
MRIGVVSDTHNNLRNVGKIVELFNDSDVARVVHTGDITQAKTLDALAGLVAPLFGVFGNNDCERESLQRAIATHGFNFQDPPFECTWHGRRIVVVHDPRDLENLAHNRHDLALHGHTHLYRLTRSAGRLEFNPGECAGHLKGYNAVGVVDLETMEAELLRF